MEETREDHGRPGVTVTLHLAPALLCSSMHPLRPSGLPRGSVWLLFLNRPSLIQQEGQANMAGASASSKRSQPKGCPRKRKERSGMLANGVPANGGSSNATQASAKSDKYVHVHEYLYTGRWGTWFNDPRIQKGDRKRRLYFGTYATEYLAARAQDRAALMFKPHSVKGKFHLNFDESDYELDRELRDKLEPDQFRRLLMGESRNCYNKKAPSPCLWKFLEEERTRTKKNLSTDSEGRYPKQPRTNAEILANIAELNKNRPVVSTVAATQAEENWDSSWEDEGQVGIVKRTKRLTRVCLAEQQPAGSRADTLDIKQERSPRAWPVLSQGGMPKAKGKLPTESHSSSPTITVSRKRLAWERTSQRSTKESLRLARAARDAAAEEQQRKNMLMLACIVSLVTDGSSKAAVEDRYERKVLDLNMRGRLVMDLNFVPQDPLTADLVEPSYEAGSGRSSEEMGAHTLLTMMKLF